MGLIPVLQTALLLSRIMLRNVVSVAGYVPDANGDLCVVVAILNHDDAKSTVGKPIVDAVMEWVTRVDSRAVLSAK